HFALAHTHPCVNAGSKAQATVRVESEDSAHRDLLSRGLGVPRDNRADAPKHSEAIDLWTIRLRRTAVLAVRNSRRCLPRTPLTTSSTASVSIRVTNTQKTNIQGRRAAPDSLPERRPPKNPLQ